MEKITRNNYEAYLLDLMEGRLSMEEQDSLREFLIRHPECAGPEERPEIWKLEDKRIVYPDRSSLKKELPDLKTKLTERNFDLFSIARLENDLSEDQAAEHEGFILRNDRKKSEWIEWQKTILQPESISYPGKQGLKKRIGIRTRVIWMSVISAAAAVTLLITIFTNDPPLPVTEKVSDVIIKDKAAESLIIADNPATLTIKKNPAPPELTGIKEYPIKKESTVKESAQPVSDPDSAIFRKAGSTEVRPLRLSGSDLSHQGLLDQVSYDQIKPLILPPSSIHLSGLSVLQLAALDRQQLFDDFTEEREFSIWSIANVGIKGINKLTGAEMDLIASRDEDGDLSGIDFNSRRFSISRNLDRP